MKNKIIYTFEDDLAKRLQNPVFKKAWDESELEYILAAKLIEKRLEKKMSQRELARKAHTTQAIISRIETMNANPSLSLLKRIASVLGAKFTLQLS